MKHREIDYSIADNRNGTWRWTLHPKLEPNVMNIVQTGEAKSEDEAVIEAKATIDKMLTKKSS